MPDYGVGTKEMTSEELELKLKRVGATNGMEMDTSRKRNIRHVMTSFRQEAAGSWKGGKVAKYK